MLRTIAACAAALDRCMVRTLERHRRELARIEIRSPLASPQRLLSGRRQTVDAAAAEVLESVARGVRARGGRVTALRIRLERCNPSVRLGLRRERLTVLRYALDRAMQDAVARLARRSDASVARLVPALDAAIGRRRTKLQLARAVLEARDPTKLLARGYAIVTVDGTALTDAMAVAPGALVTAQLARGRLAARVESVSDDGGK
jgi:exonuclease VII large subunit